MLPGDVWLKVAWALPSPQFTSTAHGESAPGSEKEPRSRVFDVPSSAFWLTGGVTEGGTFDTVTLNVVCPESPSLSVTFTVTVKEPLSANVWDWEPSEPAADLVNVVCAEPSPQLTSTAHGESAPGSEKVPRLKLPEVPSLAPWSTRPD